MRTDSEDQRTMAYLRHAECMRKRAQVYQLSCSEESLDPYLNLNIINNRSAKNPYGLPKAQDLNRIVASTNGLWDLVSDISILVVV